MFVALFGLISSVQEIILRFSSLGEDCVFFIVGAWITCLKTEIFQLDHKLAQYNRLQLV